MLAIVALGALGSVATAAVTPKPGSVYFYVSHGHFSITLQAKTAKRLAPGNIAANIGVSGVLTVCPPSGNGAVVELQASFPGAKLKLSHRHYGFAFSYRLKHARLNVIAGPAAGTHTSIAARVKVSGTVASAKLITGTVSVTAKGCSLPASRYRARRTKGL
jgi:hypothetical protein